MCLDCHFLDGHMGELFKQWWIASKDGITSESESLLKLAEAERDFTMQQVMLMQLPSY